MGKHISFKPYQPSQGFLLPPSLGELIAPNHPVYTVSNIVDGLNIDALLEKYALNKKEKRKDFSKGGQNPYHPKMLLKVLVYGYISNIYSSRKLEAACRENIHFMFLAGMNKPDHHTINRFRSERLKDVLKEVFSQVVILLSEAGHLSIKEVFTDGTKIESVANRYTFVWAKSIKNNREKIATQLEALWKYAQKIAAEEFTDPTPTDFTPIDGKSVEASIEKINNAIKDKEDVPKEVKAKLAHAKKNWPDAVDRYNEQEKILAGRNSYSKTDSDATFMHMKEDQMQNGQLKPGYNLQLSTSNQFIVHYSIHPNPTDTLTLPVHLIQYQLQYGCMPEVVVADAGYGSEQNYEFLEQAGIEAFVKHNNFDNDRRKEAQQKKGGIGLEDKKPFTPDMLHYNPDRDCFICPMGQVMEKIGESAAKTEGGYTRLMSSYQAKNCNGCPLRGVCNKGEGNRIIETSHRGRQLRVQAVERLCSEQGILLRRQRAHDVEPVFGNVKSNHGFRRFLLKGKRKVEIEVGLLALAQNLRKHCTKNETERRKKMMENNEKIRQAA